MGDRLTEAQRRCKALRDKGDKVSLRKAAAIEAKWRDHPDYENDHAWLLRMQAGAHALARTSPKEGKKDVQT